MNEPLSISPLRSLSRAATSRIAADVDGVEVWFEADDLPLRASPEAFTSAFLIPAAALERRLTVCDPVAADFTTALPRILDIVAGWWGYSKLLPSLDNPAVTPPQNAAGQPGTTARRGTALCFSGGVDSFYSLLALGRHIDAIVFVHGFDIKIDDVARATVVEQHLRAVAAAVGVQPVVVRTNLRAHPAFRTTDWNHTHGGALAAIGHLLADEWNTLLVSAAYPLDNPEPCGSHRELDSLWSGAGLTVEHVGAERDRTGKLAVLKDDPLVQRYLRVCWENRSDRLNCSRCEKCIRNEVVLQALGALDSFAVFEPAATLATRVDGVPAIRNAALFRRYNSALAMGLPRDTARAVRRLLARSRRARVRRRIADARWYAAAVARRIARLAARETSATVIAGER